LFLFLFVLKIFVPVRVKFLTVFVFSLL